MAGLGFEPDDFALFEIENPGERDEALEAEIRPKLEKLGREVIDGLQRMAGHPLYAHIGRPARKKGRAPEEMFIAFCDNQKGYKGSAYLALSITRDHVHARVGAEKAADKKGAMRKALVREAGNLAKKGKPFRKLRSYAAWDYEELPEVAPAHSAAFWEELSDELGGGALDVGIAWSSQDARSMAVGDVLGAFRDLAPLYKLLANAQ